MFNPPAPRGVPGKPFTSHANNWKHMYEYETGVIHAPLAGAFSSREGESKFRSWLHSCQVFQPHGVCAIRAWHVQLARSFRGRYMSRMSRIGQFAPSLVEFPMVRSSPSAGFHSYVPRSPNPPRQQLTSQPNATVPHPSQVNVLTQYASQN